MNINNFTVRKFRRVFRRIAEQNNPFRFDADKSGTQRNLKFFSAIRQKRLRLSPRLDNFYQKIGVKPLVLLYPIVCRLQVPK